MFFRRRRAEPHDAVAATTPRCRDCGRIEHLTLITSWQSGAINEWFQCADHLDFVAGLHDWVRGLSDDEDMTARAYVARLWPLVTSTDDLRLVSTGLKAPRPLATWCAEVLATLDDQAPQSALDFAIAERDERWARAREGAPAQRINDGLAPTVDPYVHPVYPSLPGTIGPRGYRIVCPPCRADQRLHGPMSQELAPSAVLYLSPEVAQRALDAHVAHVHSSGPPATERRPERDTTE